LIANLPVDSDAIDIALAEDILLDDSKARDRVIVVGAGLVGSELALHLVQKDREVTVVDTASDIVGGVHGVCPANYFVLKELFDYHGVKQQMNSVLTQVHKDGVVVQTESGNVDIAADQVIIAVGYEKYGDLAERLYREYPGKVVNIGDSKAIKTIMNAVYEGYEVARSI
jgi:2-enoate reductase